MIRELIKTNRTCRRFVEGVPVERQTLVDLVDLARLSASGGNVQPLRYILSAEPEKNALIFPHLVWAGYLTDWPGPAKGERPAGYIIILGDTETSGNFWCDHGIAAQSMLLGAVEQGLAGCIIGSVEEGLRPALNISARYEILLVLALGKPAEQVVIEQVEPGGNIEYWRDEDGVHHVPKRSLDELIIG